MFLCCGEANKPFKLLTMTENASACALRLFAALIEQQDIQQPPGFLFPHLPILAIKS